MRRNPIATSGFETRLVAAIAFAFLALALCGVGAYAQAKKPISREGLVKAVRINGLSTAELVAQIETRGVAFQMTSDAEQELRQAGARPEVIEAARRNFRSSPVVSATGKGKGRTQPGAGRITTGGRRPDYDELTDEATTAFYARDAGRATQLLQQAIRIDSSQPRAYQLLGFTQLYLQGNITEAERNMRRAIELGGSAAFRVFHDHAQGSFRDTCAGTLFVTRTNVTFKADDGAHTFEANDPDIREIKVNKLVGSALGVFIGGAGDIGAFHIKVKRAGDTKNYNFAPLTKKAEEAKLIVGLVQSYGGVKS